MRASSLSLRAPLSDWFWIWGALAAAVLWLRPALPVDETRYLAVAWEMWWRGSVAVSYLNGDLYAGKPPLAFWLMQLGWLVGGVNEWWPRLVAPLFGLGSLALLRSLARRLWPGRGVEDAAALILLGSLWWALFLASAMIDMLLGFFALAAVHAIVCAREERRMRRFVVAGLALGLGILAKGPVVFVPAVLVLASEPWWARRMAPGVDRRFWFGGFLASVGIAALVAAAWLVPMARAGGIDYFMNMVFRQGTGYVVDSFAHPRPWWWYLPVLPLALFPWALWPRAWRALARIRAAAAAGDAGVRLCLVWALGGLAFFTLVSAKQAHYLLILFPAVALLLARLLPEVEKSGDRTLLLPALAYAGGALALVAASAGLVPANVPAWLRQTVRPETYIAATAMLGIAALTLAAARAEPWLRLRVLAAGCGAALLTLTWGLMRASWPAYDVRPASAIVARLLASGVPIAVADQTYSGEFNFYGRIRAKIDRMAPNRAAEWARAHPGGYVVAYYGPGEWPLRGERVPAFQALYRTGGLAIWEAAAVAADPRFGGEAR